MFTDLSDKLQDIFKELRGHGTINESNIDAALRQVRLALLEADVDFQVARKFIARVKEKALGETVLRSITPGQQIVKIFHAELALLLGGDAEPLRVEDETPILIVGLNGSGKTTSAAKLALLLKKQARMPLLVACDLQRPAAIEQLATLGTQIDVPVHIPDPGEKNVQRVAAAVSITGIILTKLDGDARGGAALSMREVTHRPIKFAGTGEKLDEFEPFIP